MVVVQAISALCQKYPRKHAVLMNFLFTMLREEVRAGIWGVTGLIQGVIWLLAPCSVWSQDPLLGGYPDQPINQVDFLVPAAIYTPHGPQYKHSPIPSH